MRSRRLTMGDGYLYIWIASSTIATVSLKVLLIRSIGSTGTPVFGLSLSRLTVEKRGDNHTLFSKGTTYPVAVSQEEAVAYGYFIRVKNGYTRILHI